MPPSFENLAVLNNAEKFHRPCFSQEFMYSNYLRPEWMSLTVPAEATHGAEALGSEWAQPAVTPF
jgi:hypothetical protein